MQILVLIKTQDIHSNRALSEVLGTSANMVLVLEDVYERAVINNPIDQAGGIKTLAKLSSPHDAPCSFRELHNQWMDEHLIKGINYHILNNYIKRKFNARLKMACKSHIQKDEEAAKAFKKVSGELDRIKSKHIMSMNVFTLSC